MYTLDTEIRRLEREAANRSFRAKIDLVRAYTRAGRMDDAHMTITDLIQTHPKDAIIRNTHLQFFEAVLSNGLTMENLLKAHVLWNLARAAEEEQEMQDEMVKLSQAYGQIGALDQARKIFRPEIPYVPVQLKGEARKECARLALDYIRGQDINNARQLLEIIIQQERPIRTQLREEEIQRWYDNRPLTSTRITYHEHPKPLPEVTNHRKAMNLDKARENLIKLIEETEKLDVSILHEYNLLFRNPWLLYNYHEPLMTYEDYGINGIIDVGREREAILQSLKTMRQERQEIQDKYRKCLMEMFDGYFSGRARGVRPERQR